MKVCFIAAGAHIHTQRWVKEMVARGVDVVLITDQRTSIRGVETIYVNRKWGRFGWFVCIPKIRKIVRAINPDLVHGHYVTSYGLWAVTCGVKPVVLTAWGSDVLVNSEMNYLSHKLTKWILERVDLATADSKYVLNVMRRLCPVIRTEEVQWGVNDISILREEKLSSNEVIHILSLRRWEPNYNIITIVDAFKLIVDSGCKVHLDLAGGGGQEELLKQIVVRHGLNNSVTFHGEVGEQEVIQLLFSSDIAVSVPESDATAMSLLESMAAALPVIVSDLPSNREWIDDYGGVVVPACNVQRLASSFQFLVDHPSIRMSMGRRNCLMIQKYALRSVHMNRMLRLYEELISEHSRVNVLGDKNE
jgi:glycosyltransferase involved in cell wall biosynthesis